MVEVGHCQIVVGVEVGAELVLMRMIGEGGIWGTFGRFGLGGELVRGLYHLCCSR